MSPVQQASTCSPTRNALARVIFACWLLLFLMGGLASTAVAKDAYVPFKESLEAAQRKGYIDAAAKRQEVPSKVQENVVFVPAPVQVEEESRLEEIAAQQKGAITLDETQHGRAILRPVRCMLARSSRTCRETRLRLYARPLGSTNGD